MAEEFTPIGTQEEFEIAVRSRIEETEQKFEGYISPDAAAKLNKDIEDSRAKIAELTEKNRAFEISAARLKIACEAGLPMELADKLGGETEKEIRADAEKLSRYIGKGKPSPMFSGEAPASNLKNAAQLEMLRALKKN